MSSKTITICVTIILFLIFLERLRYLPNNVVVSLYLRSELRGRELGKRKLFADYLKRFNKSYETDEVHKRFRYFKKNLQEIERLNDGRNAAVFGVTKFSDWSKQELQQMLSPELGRSHCASKALECGRSGGLSRRRFKTNAGKIPKRLDWRKSRVVGPIVDQRRCQICWAASIAGVMESMAAIHGYGLHSLSVQQLMDCTYYDDSDKTGCYRGRPPIDVFEYLCGQHTRLARDADYPLTLADETCKDNIHGVIRLNTFNNSCVMHKNESELVEVLSRGPVTALVWAELLFIYDSGVISWHCQVPEGAVNHAVQIVGYDTTSNPPYYIIKNSWGEDWGEGGYARLAIGGNQCGVAYSVGILDVSNSGPDTISGNDITKTVIPSFSNDIPKLLHTLVSIFHHSDSRVKTHLAESQRN